jgi:hypothetical protein
MNLPKIGPTAFIATFNLFGTIMLKHWTFQCRGTSKRCCKNTSIASPQNRNIVLIPCPQNNTARRHKNLTLLTFHPCCHQMKSKKLNESSAASYTMPAPSTSILTALSLIAIKQSKGTTSTMDKGKQLLNYLAANLNATMRFKAPDMIMSVHLDALYLSKANTRSKACGHFFHRMRHKRR